MAVLTFTGSSAILNWGSASSWIPSQVPTIADICIFTSSSATCSLNIPGTCSGIDFTNYRNQFRFNNNNLVVYGNIAFGANMGYSFSTAVGFSGYNLIAATTSTITSNGATIGVPFGLYNFNPSNNTYTIVDNMNVGENFGTGANSGGLTHTINGATISLYKGFAINGIGSNSSTTFTTGSSNIVMLGTGTITAATTITNGFGNNFTLQGAGPFTMPLNIYYRTGTFSIIGTPTLSGNFALNITGATSLIAASSSSTYLIPIALGSSTAQTVTLLSNIHSSRGINTTGLVLNGFNYYIYGNTLNNVTNNMSGTTVIYLSGTGSGSNINCSATTAINNNIVINSPGSVTFTTNFYWSGTSFVYTAGNVTFPTAGNNAFLANFANVPTLDTSGMVFTNFQPTGNTGTMSLNSTLNCTNMVFNSTSDWKFTGSAGWITQTLTYNSNPATIRTGLGLAAGLTYTVVGTMSIIPPSTAAGTVFGIRSLTPGSTTNFVFLGGNQQTNYYMVGNDIDSSGGNTIWIFNYESSTASVNTTNWRKLQASSMQQQSISIS